MHTPRPWYRKSKRAYYVQFGNRQFRLGTTREEAQEKFRELLLHEGATTTPTRRYKVNELCDLFLDWSLNHNERVTYDYYRQFLQNFCDQCGTLDVSALKPYYVTKWLDGHQWNQSTRRAGIISVKRVFNWAVDEGYLIQSPIKKLKKPPVNRREVVLSLDQQKAIFDKARGECFKDLVFAMQETGCRPGEIAKVTAADTDLNNGVWIFQKHKTRHKTGKPRLVYLTAPMIELSRKLVAKYPEGPIFRNRHGKPWTRNAVICRFRRIREKLGLKGVVAYTYRHTYATDALVNGVDPISVCELLGHSDPAMLMKHYQHLSQKVDHLRNAAERARRPNGCAAAPPPAAETASARAG